MREVVPFLKSYHIWIKEGDGGGGGQKCNETQGVLYTLYCAHKCKWGENDKRGG